MPARLLVWFLVAGISGCAMATTTERLPRYFGDDPSASAVPKGAMMSSEGLRVGLTVINDTTAGNSAPALSADGLKAVVDRLAWRLKGRSPFTTLTVLDQPELSVGGTHEQFTNLARRHGVTHLLVAVVSSVEVEVPDRFSVDGMAVRTSVGRGLLGVRAENHALVELAFVSGETGRPLVNATGSAWAVLERLQTPLASNVYPVVRRGLTQPPIYPGDAAAYDTLRRVAADDAAQQALMHFEEQWETAS